MKSWHRRAIAKHIISQDRCLTDLIAISVLPDLKLPVLNAVHASTDLEKQKGDIARCFTDAVADTLRHKCERAMNITGLNTLVVAGGVSANTAIRNCLSELMENRGGKAFFARREFCTDNGAMIALAGMMRFKAGQIGTHGVDVFPRWPLDSLKGFIMDKIFINGLKVSCIIGILPDERVHEQPLIMDVCMEHSLKQAGEKGRS